jgi:hypothetical protein
MTTQEREICTVCGYPLDSATHRAQLEQPGSAHNPEGAEGSAGAQPSAPSDLEDMTVAQLKDYAEAHDIDLPSDARKADIIEAIESAEEERN